MGEASAHPPFLSHFVKAVGFSWFLLCFASAASNHLRHTQVATRGQVGGHLMFLWGLQTSLSINFIFLLHIQDGDLVGVQGLPFSCLAYSNGYLSQLT